MAHTTVIAREGWPDCGDDGGLGIGDGGSEFIEGWGGNGVKGFGGLR